MNWENPTCLNFLQVGYVWICDYEFPRVYLVFLVVFGQFLAGWLLQPATEGVTGGVDWHQIADPLIDDISPWSLGITEKRWAKLGEKLLRLGIFRSHRFGEVKKNKMRFRCFFDKIGMCTQ